MFIKNFTELGKEDAGIAGGKGASLGEMTSAGIPVPPGFVVLSDAFEQFLKETDLAVEIDTILHTVDTQAMHTVEHASERIQKLILEAKMPEDIARDIEHHFQTLGAQYVAVRSSATAEDSASAAWAGQLDSFLNTTEESLLGNVKRCWASLFTPRAIFYRFEQGLHDTHISVAVVVQKMIESEVSGIAFSVHPVTEDRNQLIIEAGYGLGEAIVSGQITPDSYVVEKAPRRIIDTNIAKQERGIYRIVQGEAPARITSVSDVGGNEWLGIEVPKQEQQKLSDEQILELSGIIITIENHYGFPCDIEWAYAVSPEPVEGKSGEFYIVQSRPITTLASLSANEWESSELLNFDPAEYEFHGRWKSNIFTCYFWTYVWHDGLAQELALPVSENGYFVMNEGSVFIKKKVADALRTTIEDVLREHDELFFSRMKAIIDREFPGQMERGRSLAAAEPTPETFREFLKVSEPLMFLWYFGYLLSYSFEKVLQERAVGAGIDPSEVSRYVPIMETPLLRRQKELSRLKVLLTERAPHEPEVEAQLREHLKEYGWIEIMNFIGEELTLEKLLDQVDHFEEPVTERSELQKTSAAMEEMFTGAAYVTYLRQVGAEYFSAYILATRPFLERTAQALGLASYRDLLMLTPDEIIGFLREGGTKHPKEKVAERMSGKWAIWSASNREVHVADSPQDIERLEGKLLQKSASSTDGIRGQIGNKGRAQGRVKIILNSDEFGKLEEGDVLVTTMTTPDFVPLMQKAAAIVTEIGGMLSHAAIVSRELGKPCVIGTKIATQVLHDGDLVEVDANTGVVRILR